MSRRKKAVRFVSGGLGEAASARHTAAADELRRGAAEVAASMRRHAGAKLPQRAGRAAEAFHAATFNANARLAGDPRVAATTDSLGMPGSATDIVVFNHGVVEASAQVKYHGTSLRTAAAAQKPGYAGQQRVVPADQLDAARTVLERSASRCAARPNRAAAAARRGDAARQLTDRLAVGKVRSEPLTRQRAEGLAQDPAQLSRAATRLQVTGAMQAGARSGALVGGVVSGVSNIVKVSKGEKSVQDALVDTAVETARSAATGAAIAGGSALVRAAAVNAGLRGLARSSAPVAIASGIVEITIDGCRVLTGEINSDEFAGRCAETAVRSGGAWAGAEVGAACGSAFGPVGTLVGGLAGGLAGYLGIGKLFGW